MPPPADRLPSAATALFRSLRMGYRTSPGLIVVAFVTTVAAAVPDALFAVGLAALVSGVIEGDGDRIALAVCAVGVLATGGWLLDVVSDRANRRFADRAAVVVESHVARLQSAVATIEHHERPDHLDRLSVLRERAGASDLVSTLDHGLDTQLGPTWEGGVELSQGQWQKIALARGFLRDAPLLLVLDEPTSALDAEIEHALFERFAEAARAGTNAATGRITLLVSHRFSTVRMADAIVVLDGARLAEYGTHEELMAAGGPYAELYGIQASAYRAG